MDLSPQLSIQVRASNNQRSHLRAPHKVHLLEHPCFGPTMQATIYLARTDILTPLCRPTLVMAGTFRSVFLTYQSGSLSGVLLLMIESCIPCDTETLRIVVLQYRYIYIYIYTYMYMYTYIVHTYIYGVMQDLSSTACARRSKPKPP